tara:strand:- start:1089 stop:2396 length:1308 start_codon:yes stop_codon:yes gene_type:complete
MRAVDATAPESEQLLIQRAGYAVANTALRMLGGGYGRRVNVIAGKGNNGQDGLVAARLLQRRGVRCKLYEPNSEPVATADLVIDAAYGTGLRDNWQPPNQPACPVLAVDIPSGVDALTGIDSGSIQADRTITFGALKPGLILEPGASRAGEVEIASLGLEIPNSKMNLITDGDLREPLSQRSATDHKWTNALRIIGGSPGMIGAAELATHGALRAGAGIVVVSSPTADLSQPDLPTEAVTKPLLESEWATEALADLERFNGLLIGPGLGSDPQTLAEAAKLIEKAPVPVIVDADGLAAVAAHPQCIKNRRNPTVLTPHDGEFKKLTGAPPTDDRCTDVRNASKDCVLLLKGPTTIVCSPNGELTFVRSGDQRLATAGSGDVLAGIMGALINYPQTHLAVAAAAHWHGRAAQLAQPGMTASDLPLLLQPAQLAMLS